MGLFERLGKKVDRGIAGIGKAISAIGRRITGVGERIEKRFEPIVAEKKTWRDKAIEAIDKEIEPGMTDEEVREKYVREDH